uniref:Uncharacterized protein n=1 Tax=Aegilops tauschii subsp. strangulata TaxID=200361 RepID=A0A453S575_AEGTS
MHRVTILPPPGSSWLHCNQRGLVNSLMPLNLYGLSLLKMDSFVQLQARPVKSEACHRMVFMVYKLLRCCLGSSFTNNIYDDMPLRVVVKS